MTIEELENRPGIIVLKNEPISGSEKGRYKAYLKRGDSTSSSFDGNWVLHLIYDFNKDNTWQGTPGSWYLDTLLGYDGFGDRVGDMLYIDYGAKWFVTGMVPVLKEAEEIVYGKVDESMEFDRTADPLTKMDIGVNRPLKPGDRVKILSKSDMKPFDTGEVLRIQKDGNIVVFSDWKNQRQGEIVLEPKYLVRESLEFDRKDPDILRKIGVGRNRRVPRSLDPQDYSMPESHPLDDLKTNFRSWEILDNPTSEDAEELYNILQARHPDFDEMQLRKIAYNWLGVDIDER